MESGIDSFLIWITELFPGGGFLSQLFNIRALLALIMVGTICGLMGSLVVGSRMAFFSDALAHCAFAGVSLGFFVFEIIQGQLKINDSYFWGFVTPLMVIFGALVGLGIAQVRHRTRLGSDTVIGVFFSGSLGLAAALSQLVQNRKVFNLEEFLFGDPLQVRSGEMIWLLGTLIIVCIFLYFCFNGLVLGSFNSSLAQSRNIKHLLLQHVFIIILAVSVNITLRLVGVLLVNALLIVPAATAMNYGGNLRQMFWLTLIICLSTSIGGPILAWEMSARGMPLGISGSIVSLSVTFFVFSLFWLHKKSKSAEISGTTVLLPFIDYQGKPMASFIQLIKAKLKNFTRKKSP